MPGSIPKERTTSLPTVPDTRRSTDWRRAPTSPPAPESPSRSADTRVPRVHSKARNKIQIALLVDVVEKHALATGENDGIAVIGLQQKLPLTFGDLFEGIHRKIRF